MKAAKCFSWLAVTVFPFSFWLACVPIWSGAASSLRPLLLILFFWVLGWIGVGCIFWMAFRGKWEGRKLAFWSMMAKLIQIPNYVALFMLGGLTIAFAAVAAVVWVVDMMTIVLSGLIGLTAILRCRAEGRLTNKAALVNGVLQFVFCADIFSAIWVYRNTKEAFLS